MNRQQSTLPLKTSQPKGFEDFMGNEALVKVLNGYPDLPQFSYLTGAQYAGKTHVLGALNHIIQNDNHSVLQLRAADLLGLDWALILPEDLSFLLLDDVDELAEDAAAEVTLFNVYNHCRQHQTKLIVTAKSNRKSNRWQLPDLRSRLTSGLSLSLETLSGDQALSCLALQFKQDGIPVDDAVMNYLKTHTNTRYTELYALYLVVAETSLKLKRKVTVPLIKQAIQDINE